MSLLQRPNHIKSLSAKATGFIPCVLKLKDSGYVKQNIAVGNTIKKWETADGETVDGKGSLTVRYFERRIYCLFK
jgi:hypothetical protein